MAKKKSSLIDQISKHEVRRHRWFDTLTDGQRDQLKEIAGYISSGECTTAAAMRFWQDEYNDNVKKSTFRDAMQELTNGS